MTPQAPKIHLQNAPDYREGYANSVQIRVNLWDFFLLFGVVNQTAPDQVSIHNFQGIYVSPQQAKAVQTQRAGSFTSLGRALYDSGVAVPALSVQVAAVAAIDRARLENDAALEASLALTRSLGSGTMPKFWAVLVGVPLVLAALGFALSRLMSPSVTPAASGTSAAATAVTNPDTEKARIVDRFIQAGRGSDQTLQTNAVGILKEDILTIGGTANAAYLPILTKILRSDQAELRAASADAIGMIGQTAAETPALTRLLDDPDPGVVAAARRALANVPESAR